MNPKQDDEIVIVDDNRKAMVFSIISITMLTIFLTYVIIFLIKPTKDNEANNLIFLIVLLWIFFPCFLIYLGLEGRKTIRTSTFIISNEIIEISFHKIPKFSISWDEFKAFQIRSFTKIHGHVYLFRRVPQGMRKTYFEITFLGDNPSKALEFITGYEFSKSKIRTILYILTDYVIERNKEFNVIIESKGFGERLLTQLRASCMV